MATVYRKDLKHVLRFHSRADAWAYAQRALAAGGEVFVYDATVVAVPRGWAWVTA